MTLPFGIKINFVTVWRLIRKYILRKNSVQKINFGLVKDKIDIRDHIYRAKFTKQELPESTELRNFNRFPYTWDQGNLGSCVGQATCGGFLLTLITNNQCLFNPSRLFAYYNARTEDCKQEDSGASIRDGIKGLVKYGVCKEETWPYVIPKFTVKPSAKAYEEGELNQVLVYERIFPVTKEKIMDAIYRGYPVVYGKRLFESFMTNKVAELGIVPYPKKCWEEEVGGHAMFIIDYEKDYVIEKNSWGDNWGFQGCCRVPWKYVLDGNLCFDFWTIYQIEGDYNQVSKSKRKKK